MLSKRTKGLFTEVNGFTYVIASVTSLHPPLTLDAIYEFPRHEPDRVREFLDTGTSANRKRYLFSHCGLIPESRFFKLHQLESMSKAKEAGYFDAVLEDQYRINPRSVRAAVVSAESGADFAPLRPLQGQKSLLLCGAEAKELNASQENLVDIGIYPNSMQLSTISTVAGLKAYLRYTGQQDPVMFVEISHYSSHLFVVTREKVELCRPIGFGFNSVLPVIQQELGLKDERSAQELFYSGTFDFRDIGEKLFSRLLKEINASTGYYEVQTGQTISNLLLTLLPQKMLWIESVISEAMEIPPLRIQWDGWLQYLKISCGDEVSPASLGVSHFGLISLFIDFESLKDAVETKK